MKNNLFLSLREKFWAALVYGSCHDRI